MSVALADPLIQVTNQGSTSNAPIIAALITAIVGACIVVAIERTKRVTESKRLVNALSREAGIKFLTAVQAAHAGRLAAQFNILGTKPSLTVRAQDIRLAWAEVQIACPSHIVDAAQRLLAAYFAVPVGKYGPDEAPVGVIPSNVIPGDARKAFDHEVVHYVGALRNEFNPNWKRSSAGS